MGVWALGTPHSQPVLDGRLFFICASFSSRDETALGFVRNLIQPKGLDVGVERFDWPLTQSRKLTDECEKLDSLQFYRVCIHVLIV